MKRPATPGNSIGGTMPEKRLRSVAGGCLGTVVGAALGCILGGAAAHAMGLRTTGNAFFLALDLLACFCIGGGGIIGAIAGRDIGTAAAGLSRARRGEPAAGGQSEGRADEPGRM